MSSNRFEIRDAQGRVVRTSDGRARGFPAPSFRGGMYGPPDEDSAESVRVRELEAEIKAIKDEPRLVATVVELRDDHMLVSLGPGNAVDIHKYKGVRVGDRVLLTRNTMQATDVIKDDSPTGTVVTLERVGDKMVEATIMGGTRAFKAPSSFKVRKGERVIVDPSMSFVIGTLGMPPAEFSLAANVTVRWDDIGGQEEAKNALREAIELPLSHPALFKAYGKKMSKGVLLSGPPGTGKTLLGKAAATAIGRAHGKEHGAFIYVKGPELLQIWIGRTEEQIRAIFKAAREHKERHGYPVVVLLDECDALLGARDRGQHTTLNATVVPQFLAEMDGLDDSAAMFLLATNRPDMLDPAVVREGRVDRKVRVERPTLEDARAIFTIHLRDRPVMTSEGTRTKKDGEEHWFGVQQMAALATERLYADTAIVRDLGHDQILARHFASGAMIAGLVEEAATLAVVDDIGAGRSRPGGISQANIDAAIARATSGLAHTDLRDVARELAEKAELARHAAGTGDIGPLP